MNAHKLLSHLLIFIAVMIVMAILPAFADADYTPKTVSKLVADIDGKNPSSTGRIPLILIHGVHGTSSATFATIDGATTNEKTYFQNFINYFYNSDLKEKYQLYRFHYLSDKLTVNGIGQGLREWLDDFIQNKKIKDGKFVILAHSMGGLVARSYMQEQQHTQGAYTSQFGGARVEKLITLATPHHGSPGANGASRDALMTNAALWQGVVELACLYYNARYSFATVISDSAVNRSDLRTDNFAFDNNTLAMSDNAWLTQLNQSTAFDDRIIAYYGSIDLSDTERTIIYNEVLNSSPLYLLTYALLGGNHQKLLVANIIMNEGLNAHFPFNDGMVPEDSAKFSGRTLNKIVKMTNYDHEQMKDGRNLLPNELFDLLKADLNNMYASSSITPIAAAEYFVDIDPGEGNGTALPAKDGTFDTTMEDIEFALPTSDLTIGVHNFYMRMKNINGVWGTPRKIMFYVEGNKYVAGEEYYIDADPGIGNGIPVTASDGSYNAAREVGTAAIDTTNLSTGLHILYVRAKDSEGHWGTPRQYKFEVVTPPAITAVEYYLDTDPGKGSGTALNAVDASFDSPTENVSGSLNTSSLSAGNHTFYLRAKDSYGRWGAVNEASINVTIDTTPPVVSSGPDQTKNTVFTQTATATDLNAMTYAWSKQAGPGTVTFETAAGLSTTITASLEGTYTIRFTATDAAGNSAFSDMTLVWDTTPPVAAIGIPSATVAKSGPVTYAVTYTGADAVTLAGAHVTLVKTGTANGTIAVSGTGAAARTVTISDITGDGTLAIAIAAGTASDLARNQALASGPSATFTVDNTPPVVNHGGDQTKNGLFTQTATGTDAGTITYAWSKQAGPGTLTFGTDTGLSTTITASLDGTYTIRFTATDAAGNSAYSDMTLVWDTTPPTIAIGAPSAAVAKSGPVTYAVTYTGADAVTLAGAHVTLVKTGTANGTIAVSGTGAAARTVTISDITGDGTLAIAIAAGTASDLARNQALASGPSAAFTVDNTPPEAVIGAPSATVTKSEAVSYAVTYTEADAVILESANVTLVKTGTANGTIAVSGTGTAARTVTISDITGDGTLGISIAAGTASDAAGNQSAASGPSTTVTVDNTPPELTLNPVTTPTGLNQQAITGTVANAVSVTVTTDTAATDGEATISANTWSFTINGLVEGTNGVTITARDAAGNVAIVAASITYANIKGDVNGDWKVDLQDAITALQVFNGMTSTVLRADFAASGADVNGDGRLGLEEVLYILQKLAGMRSGGSTGGTGGTAF